MTISKNFPKLQFTSKNVTRQLSEVRFLKGNNKTIAHVNHFFQIYIQQVTIEIHRGNKTSYEKIGQVRYNTYVSCLSYKLVLGVLPTHCEQKHMEVLK